MSQKPTVLVTGATGQQGGAVVTELLKGNKVSIRGMTRNPSAPKAEALAAKGVEVVKADMSDASSLRSALSGVSRAFLVTDNTGPKGAEAEQESGKAFVAAAKEAGVEHVVFSSVGDANNATGVPHFESKFAVEQALKSSGIPGWTILRPVAYMDNLPTTPGFKRAMGLGVFASLLEGKKLKVVAVQDIGWFAARALEEPKKWQGKELDLVGDELTVTEMQEAYKRVQGGAAWAAWMPSVALGAMLPKDAWLMFKFFREKGYSADAAACRNLHPGMLNFEQWLRTKSQP